MMSRFTVRAFGSLSLLASLTACKDRGTIGYGGDNAAGHTNTAVGGSQAGAGSASGGHSGNTNATAIGVGGGKLSTGGTTASGGATTSVVTTASGGATTSIVTPPRGGVAGADSTIPSAGASSGGRAASGGGAAGGSTGGLGGSAGAAGANQLVLDPTSLEFFDLPINSVRWAVSGYAPNERTCVTITWDYSNTGHADGAHCDDFANMFPYAIAKTNTDGPCKDWDYGGNARVDNWSGCIDFRTYMGLNYVNSIVSVTSEQFTGQIVLDNRSLLPQPAVVLGIRADTANYPSLYVQLTSGRELPAWVSVTKDGSPIAIADRCDVPPCGGTALSCTSTTRQAMSVIRRTGLNSIADTWDGYIRRLDSVNNCLVKEPAPAGAYRAQFCYGTSVTTSGSTFAEVNNPVCVSKDFTYPTEQVFVTLTGT